MRIARSRGPAMERLAICTAILAAIVLIVLLYVEPSNVPFGNQIVTGIAYTGAMLVFIFFKRGALPEFNLWDDSVRAKLPRLLLIHAAFVVLIISVQTLAFAMRHRLPTYWLTEYSKRHTLFDDMRFVIYGLVATIQALISRGILSGGLEAHKSDRGPIANANLAPNDRM